MVSEQDSWIQKSYHSRYHYSFKKTSFLQVSNPYTFP